MGLQGGRDSTRLQGGRRQQVMPPMAVPHAPSLESLKRPGYYEINERTSAPSSNSVSPIPARQREEKRPVAALPRRFPG